MPSSRVAAAPAGAGATAGRSGVPVEAEPAIEDAADGSSRTGSEGSVRAAATVSADSSSASPRGLSGPRGSNASFAVSCAAALSPSIGSRRTWSRLPSAVTECSTSCRVAITSRVNGRLPSCVGCTFSAATRPSAGARSARPALGSALGSSTTTWPSALRKLVQTRGALASRSTNTSGAPSRRSKVRISAAAGSLGLRRRRCSAEPPRRPSPAWRRCSRSHHGSQQGRGRDGAPPAVTGSSGHSSHGTSPMALASLRGSEIIAATLSGRVQSLDHLTERLEGGRILDLLFEDHFVLRLMLTTSPSKSWSPSLRR